MRRVVFVNRFFFPDHSATSQLVSDLAFHLTESGCQVLALTSSQVYDDPKAELPSKENIKGVQVRRLPSTRFGRTGLPGRAIDYFSFYRSVLRYLRGVLRRDDILIAKTDPPLLCLAVWPAAHQSGAPLVNWSQDLYPEIAVELGVPLVRGPPARMLTRLRNRCFKSAAANVVVGELMREKVVALGVPARKIHFIPNWCDDEQLIPVPHVENPLRREWVLEERFVVGYSGNLGRAHEFRTILAAAEQLRDQSHILFLMIGGGQGFDELSREVSNRQLQNLFRFLPYQAQAHLKYSLSAPDVHWLSLRPEVEGLIVPSKFYGIAAAGRPTIAIGAQDGEIAHLVRENRCGLAIATDDSVNSCSEPCGALVRPRDR